MRRTDGFIVLIDLIILITIILGLIVVLPKIDTYNQIVEGIK